MVSGYLVVNHGNSGRAENDPVELKDLRESPNMHGSLQVRGKPSWRATKALRANHQIREGDLKESESWLDVLVYPRWRAS